MKRTEGNGDDSIVTRKKNAFRFPKSSDSEFPQQPAPIYIDRRSKSLPAEYLMKEKGIKKKNAKKKAQIETLNTELKAAEARAEGKTRENEVIDLNNLVQLDEYGNIDMGADEAKEDFMDIDEDNMDKKGKTLRRKKNKKNKSHYIVNF